MKFSLQCSSIRRNTRKMIKDTSKKPHRIFLHELHHIRRKRKVNRIFTQISLSFYVSHKAPKKDLFIFECFWRHPEEFKYVGCGSRNVRRKGTKIRFSPACRSARQMCVIPAILRGLPRPASGNDCQAAPRSYQVPWDTVYTIKERHGLGV